MRTKTLLNMANTKRELHPGGRHHDSVAALAATSRNIPHSAGLKFLTTLLILLTGWLALKVGTESVGLHNDLDGLTNALNQAVTR